jgi:hypothetical protein
MRRAMMTFHIPAHAGSGEHDYAWAYSGHWDRTVEAINRRSIKPSGLCVFTESGDEFVERFGCVVQSMSEEQYAALPASLRRRLDAVRV